MMKVLCTAVEGVKWTLQEQDDAPSLHDLQSPLQLSRSRPTLAVTHATPRIHVPLQDVRFVHQLMHELGVL